MACGSRKKVCLEKRVEELAECCCHPRPAGVSVLFTFCVSCCLQSYTQAMGASWRGQPGDAGSDPTPFISPLLLTFVHFTQQQSGFTEHCHHLPLLMGWGQVPGRAGKVAHPFGGSRATQAPSGRSVVPLTACHSPVGWEHISGCWLSAQHSQIHASPLATASHRAAAAALANYLADSLIPSKPLKALLLLGTLPASWSREQGGGRQWSRSPG